MCVLESFHSIQQNAFFAVEEPTALALLPRLITHKLLIRYTIMSQVAVPYAERKLERFFEKLQHDASLVHRANKMTAMQKLYLRLYPYLKAVQKVF